MATATLDIHCGSCGATLTVEAHHRTANCPYCDSASVVERPTSENRPDPEFVLGFGVVRERAERLVKGWIRSRGIFAHSGLKTATLEKIRGIYLPAYLYGAIAESEYDAQIGENYTVTETYTTTDSNGRTVVRTRTRTKTEWRYLSGHHATYILDVLVTASNGIPNPELQAVEPFDLRALRRYSSTMVSGWIAEEPSLTKDACFELAHDESVAKVGAALNKFMPGDSFRDLNYRTTLRDEVIDLVLLPIWVFAVRYREDRDPIRILVNGQTGEVQGRVPLSPLKISIAALLAIGLVVAAIVMFSSKA